jgi:hypothetical protein
MYVSKITPPILNSFPQEEKEATKNKNLILEEKNIYL